MYLVILKIETLTCFSPILSTIVVLIPDHCQSLMADFQCKSNVEIC